MKDRYLVSARQDGFHVNSRQFSYPNSKLTRFPVPEEKVPWEVLKLFFSTTKSPVVMNGNPGGRTGISGRGALSCLGPNLSVELVITRWRDSEKSVLEYLAVSEKCLNHSREKGSILPGLKLYINMISINLNTDNAWVEMTVLNIHLDRKSQVMVDINNTVTSSVLHNGALQWQEVSSKATLGSNQRESLRLAAALHNRKF
uniref:Uncharacterized protein n=1 Tax=Neolamprologus brichardi TaxID=32507 RepID=A0A3Q4MXJ7_NEOBR